MTDLLLHQRPVETVFDLLGDKENDLTYSLGWALSQSPRFCIKLLAGIFPKQELGEVLAVRLQEHGSCDRGYTDIEIRTEHAHVIIEAKRGWNLPKAAQLARYAPRLRRERAKHQAIAVLAECSPEYVNDKIPKHVYATPVRYLSWKKVADLAGQSRTHGSHAERHILSEINNYLRSLMSMQNQESNLVYLLVLGDYQPDWASLTWIEFVTKKHRYFHPLGGHGWPKEPPNYLGFRYKGRLQHIHHVDNYEIVDDFASYFDEIDQKKWSPHKDADAYILYRLGPEIYPAHEVKNGKVYANGRLWATLDLLLTCSTIEQACAMTKKRLAKVK